MTLTEAVTGKETAACWRMGTMLVAICLAGFSLVICSLVLSPSLMAISGCLSMYLQVFGSVLLLLGIWLLPSGLVYSTHMRVCGIIFAFLSPFVTWEFSGQGGGYINYNSILWQFFGFECIRIILRQYAMQCEQNFRHRSALAYQGIYWLFLILVFAPYCARAVDVIGISYVLDLAPVRSVDVWNSPLVWLDLILKLAALCGFLVVTVSGFMAIPILSKGPVAAGGSSDSESALDPEDSVAPEETSSIDVSEGISETSDSENDCKSDKIETSESAQE